MQIAMTRIATSLVDRSVITNVELFQKQIKTRNLLYRINLGRTKKYDLIWFLHSFTYKKKEGEFY